MSETRTYVKTKLKPVMSCVYCVLKTVNTIIKFKKLTYFYHIAKYSSDTLTRQDHNIKLYQIGEFFMSAS